MSCMIFNNDINQAKARLNILLNISYQEKIAIIYASSLVACADNELSIKEIAFAKEIVSFLGIADADNASLKSIGINECCNIMSSMSPLIKRFASAVLMQTMMADGKKLISESNITDTIMQKADLPSLNSFEASEILRGLGLRSNVSPLDILRGT